MWPYSTVCGRPGRQPQGQVFSRHCLYCTIPLLPKSEISSLYAYSVPVQPGLWQTRLETPKTDFLTICGSFVFEVYDKFIHKLACLTTDER